MKTFVSWSGKAAKELASAVSHSLELIVPEISCFVSADEIEKGARWSNEIARELESSNYGLLILTKENLSAPWVFFEAGALSKSLEKGRVTPVLFGVDVADISSTPLSQFQCTFYRERDMSVLCVDLAKACAGKDVGRTISYFEKFWPDLDRSVQTILRDNKIPATSEDPKEIVLRDILNSLRQLNARTADPSRMIPVEHLARSLIMAKDEGSVVRDLIDHIKYTESLIADIEMDVSLADTDDKEEMADVISEVQGKIGDFLPLDFK